MLVVLLSSFAEELTAKFCLMDGTDEGEHAECVKCGDRVVPHLLNFYPLWTSRLFQRDRCGHWNASRAIRVEKFLESVVDSCALVDRCF